MATGRPSVLRCRAHIIAAIAALAATLPTTIAEAGCRTAQSIEECKLTGTIAAPGGTAVIAVFPRRAPVPTFSVVLDWCLNDFGCEDSGERCILWVRIDKLPPIGVNPPVVEFSGAGDGSYALPDRPPHVGIGRDTGAHSGRDGAVQFVATNGETMILESSTLRFDNNVCWAGVHAKYVQELARLYR